MFTVEGWEVGSVTDVAGAAVVTGREVVVVTVEAVVGGCVVLDCTVGSVVGFTMVGALTTNLLSAFNGICSY
jgi:hypothetical protein